MQKYSAIYSSLRACAKAQVFGSSFTLHSRCASSKASSVIMPNFPPSVQKNIKQFWTGDPNYYKKKFSTNNEKEGQEKKDDKDSTFCEEDHKDDGFLKRQRWLGQAGAIVAMVAVLEDMNDIPDEKDRATAGWNTPFWEAAYLSLGLVAGGMTGALIGPHFPIPFVALLVYVTARSGQLYLSREDRYKLKKAKDVEEKAEWAAKYPPK